MRNLLVSSVLAITVSFSAHAADAPAPAPAPPCITLDMLKADLKGAKLTKLNAGQFHYMQGVFSGTAPAGPPPNADTAYLGQMKKRSFIVWMVGNPSCVIKSAPVMPIPDGMVGVLKSIAPGTGEIFDGYSDDSKDLHI